MSPSDCRHDVTRADPAQISTMKGSFGMGLLPAEKLQKEFDWPSPVAGKNGSHFGGGCFGCKTLSEGEAVPLRGSSCTEGRPSSGKGAIQVSTLRFFVAGSAGSSQDFL